MKRSGLHYHRRKRLLRKEYRMFEGRNAREVEAISRANYQPDPAEVRSKMAYPDNYRYSKSHEWVSLRDDLATIGITDHAQSQLGDVVHLELPEVGTAVVAGEIFGTVDSVKAISDLISPVSGEVVEINEDLIESPEIINEDPHTSGWMIIVRLDDVTEPESLMTAELYEEFTEIEA